MVAPAIAAGAAGLAVTMTGLSLVVGGAVGAVKLATAGLNKVTESAGAISKAFTGLDISLKNLTGAYNKSLASADELQKRNLALGRDFTGFRKTFGASLDKMPGVLSEKLGAIMTGVETGLRSNTAQTHRLIQFTRMTGGNFKAFATKLAGLQISFGLNNNSLENLSLVTRSAVDKYGVAAERMIGSMDNLAAQTKKNIVMSGQGPKFFEAMIQLSGKLGGRATGAQGAIQDILFGEDIAPAAMLGLLGARQRAQHGGVQDILGASMEVINKGWPKANRMLKNFGGDTAIAGKVMSGLVPVAHSLQEAFIALRVEGDSVVRGQVREFKVRKQLEEINKKIWEKIQKIWLGDNGLYASLLRNADEIGRMFDERIATPLGKILSTFSDLFLNSNSLLGSFEGMLTHIGTFISAIDIWLDSTFGDKENVFKFITEKVEDMFIYISKGFGELIYETLPSIKVGFFTIITGLLSLIDKVAPDDWDPHDKFQKEMVAALHQAKEDRIIGLIRAGREPKWFNPDTMIDSGSFNTEQASLWVQPLNWFALAQEQLLHPVTGEVEERLNYSQWGTLLEFIGVPGWLRPDSGEETRQNLLDDSIIFRNGIFGGGDGKKFFLKLKEEYMKKADLDPTAKTWLEYLQEGLKRNEENIRKSREEQAKEEGQRETNRLLTKTLEEEEKFDLSELASAQAMELSEHISTILSRDDWREQMLRTSVTLIEKQEERMRQAALLAEEEEPRPAGGD